MLPACATILSGRNIGCPDKDAMKNSEHDGAFKLATAQVDESIIARSGRSIPTG